MASRWSKEENDLLTKIWGTIKIDEVVKLFPIRNRQTIIKQASNLKLKGNPSLANSKYTFNDNFFNTPTVQNSYWAGFIAADGCITKDSITIGLAAKDIEILETFKNQIQYTGPIKYYKAQQCYDCVKLNIRKIPYTTYLYEHWNIIPRKSLTLQPPNLTDLEHIYAYIIGYIDGDGCITLNHNRRYPQFSLGVVGTKAIVEWVHSYLSKLYPPTYRGEVKIHKHKTAKCYNVVYTGKRAVNIYYNLQQQANIPWKLQRKWSSFIEKYTKELSDELNRKAHHKKVLV